MRIILITFILIVNLSHPLFAKIASVIGNPLSQEIYFEVNKDTKNYPASLTKIMTL
jgi:D-alanyl-D-alanine carboxypeptidase